MQIMFDAGCVPALYQLQGKSFPFPDLTSALCPNCRAGTLEKHGFYKRYLIEPCFEGEIIIRRFCCHSCYRTVSLLPSFCHPKRSYSLLAVFGVLFEFYTKTNAVCLAIKGFMSASGVRVSRQLLLHYRRRIEKNIDGLIAAAFAIHPLRPPPAAKASAKEKVRQFLLSTHPLDDSLELFERTRATYLTPYAL